MSPYSVTRLMVKYYSCHSYHSLGETGIHIPNLCMTSPTIPAWLCAHHLLEGHEGQDSHKGPMEGGECLLPLRPLLLGEEGWYKAPVSPEDRGEPLRPVSDNGTQVSNFSANPVPQRSHMENHRVIWRNCEWRWVVHVLDSRVLFKKALYFLYQVKYFLTRSYNTSSDIIQTETFKSVLFVQFFFTLSLCSLSVCCIVGKLEHDKSEMIIERLRRDFSI